MLELLTIEELAERSGVSIRTIRFYITEGLLPSPLMRGRNAAYTAEALYRLILIQRLKDAHLPLKEIRNQLDALTPERIRQLAEEQDLDLESNSFQSAAPDEPVSPVEEDTAVEYISKILDARSVYLQSDQSLKFLQPAQARKLHKPVPHEPPGDWLRIEIAPGIELHVREPLDPLTQKKISQIKEMVKILFQ
jgi:DNA-binding transcriptional MerR regulator